MSIPDKTQISNVIDKVDEDSTNSVIWGLKSGNEKNVPKFGEEMKKHFLLGNTKKSKNVAFCNHGSYGATPKYVMEKRMDLLLESESNPDLWYRSEMYKREILSTEKLARFVGADSATDLVYVDNVAEAVNIILKVMFRL